MWEQGLCIHFSPFPLFSLSHTHFQFFLWLQEDNKQLNFQDVNIVFVPCRSHRNSFSSPLYFIRERDSVITNINATQKPLRTCEVKKYKTLPKNRSMPAQIMFFAKASGRKKDRANKLYSFHSSSVIALSFSSLSQAFQTDRLDNGSDCYKIVCFLCKLFHLLFFQSFSSTELLTKHQTLPKFFCKLGECV